MIVSNMRCIEGGRTRTQTLERPRRVAVDRRERRGDRVAGDLAAGRDIPRSRAPERARRAGADGADEIPRADPGHVRGLAAAPRRVDAGAEDVGLDLRRFDAPEDGAGAPRPRHLGEVRVVGAPELQVAPPRHRDRRRPRRLEPSATIPTPSSAGRRLPRAPPAASRNPWDTWKVHVRRRAVPAADRPGVERRRGP